MLMRGVCVCVYCRGRQAGAGVRGAAGEVPRVPGRARGLPARARPAHRRQEVITHILSLSASLYVTLSRSNR